MSSRKAIKNGSFFGRLEVISDAGHDLNKDGKRLYCVMARCICGEEIRVRESSLRGGNTKSCGCLQKDHARSGTAGKKHGLCYAPTYGTWRAMMRRCFDESSTGYKYWGGRGIIVCERWKTFELFLEDMGERPFKHTLDRISNDGNYEPSNCRWADKRTQSENTSQVILVELHGEFMSTTAALKKLGLTPSMAIDRMKRKGLTRQQAIDYYASKQS